MSPVLERGAEWPLRAFRTCLSVLALPFIVAALLVVVAGIGILMGIGLLQEKFSRR